MHYSSIRKSLLQKRASLSPKERYYASGLIVEHLNLILASIPTTRVIAAYYPLALEANILPFVQNKALEPSVTIALPKIIEKDHSLKFAIWEPNSLLTQGLFNIPTSQGNHIVPEVLLVPMVGYNDQGDRMGYGGGYYDRTLAELRIEYNPLVLGICFEICQLPSTYSAQAHDQKMSLIVTENRIIDCR